MRRIERLLKNVYKMSQQELFDWVRAEGKRLQCFTVPYLAWGAVTVDDLARIAGGLGGVRLSSILSQLVIDIECMGTGLPDLVVFPRRLPFEVETVSQVGLDTAKGDPNLVGTPSRSSVWLIEVKSKADKLRSNQSAWLCRLARNGIDSGMIRVLARTLEELPQEEPI